ncbi:MAG: hypothetical protein WAL22_07295 [Solirubrobacteraceae bacterium]
MTGAICVLAAVCVAAASGPVTARTAVARRAFRTVGPACDLSDNQLLNGAFEIVGARGGSEFEVPLCAAGTIEIRFHGSRAAGCARRGLCRYAGVESFAPRLGNLLYATYRLDGRPRSEASLLWLGASRPTIVVRRRGRIGSPGRTCRFTDSAAGPGQDGVVRHGRVLVPLFYAGTNPWPAPCAQPSGSGLPELPPLSFPAALLRDEPLVRTLDAARPFRSGGIVGTVSMRLHIRTGFALSLGPPGGMPGSKPAGQRFVELEYRAVSITGTVRAGWSHEPTGCAALDACGLSGVTRIAPGHPVGPLQLIAAGPVHRPERDFLTALGLARGGNPTGIDVSGTLPVGPGGVVSTRALQAPAQCRDAVTDSDGDLGSIQINPVNGVLATTYYPSTPSGDGLRTSCPGPLLGDRPAATGAFAPNRAVGRKLIVTLARATSFQSFGFGVRLTSDLRVRLIRTATRRGRCAPGECPLSAARPASGDPANAG